MYDDKAKPKKGDVVEITNIELKKVIIDIGADIVDSLDSIHNALVNQRKEMKKVQVKIDSLSPDIACKKESEIDDSSKENSDDSYRRYIA